MFISFVVVNFTGSDGIRTKIIDGDGSGLYAYLPAIFIYKTTDFTQIFELEKTRRANDYQGHYFHKHEEKLINKFTTGTALLQLPFFLIAWLLSILFGYNADGYNLLFQYSVAVSALCWAMIGILYFVKLTKCYEIKETVGWFVAIVGFFGTNLFFYAFISPAASHIYSFAIISIFLYYTKRTFVQYSRKTALIAAFLLGLVVLIRPVNFIVIAAIPFLSGSLHGFYETIKKKLRHKDFLFTVPFFFFAILPQLLINYLQTDQPIVYGYKNEGFYFTDPEFISFLFSYRKGWFVYTPFMLLIIPALLRMLKRSFYEMCCLTGFSVILVYVFSSWWNWIYGDSFGMRPMVDYYALFLLPIAIMTADFRSKFYRSILVTFSSLTVLLNLFQTYQYTNSIIHPDSMTKSAYWHVFLKHGEEYRNVIADADEYFYGKLSAKPFFEASYDFNAEKEGWTSPREIYFIPDTENPSMKLDQQNIYGATFRQNIPKSMYGSGNVYVIFKAGFYEAQIDAASGALFVVDISNAQGKNVFYKAFKVKRLPDEVINKWRPGQIGFKLPLINEEMKTIKFYIWNKEKNTFYIKSIKLAYYRIER